MTTTAATTTTAVATTTTSRARRRRAPTRTASTAGAGRGPPGVRRDVSGPTIVGIQGRTDRSRMGSTALRHPARLAGAPLLRLQSDERLTALALDGHEAAFAAIVDRYRGPLLR